MAQPITYVVTLEAKPEHSDHIIQDLLALLADTRAEPGCVEYQIHRSNDNPTMWMVYETWASQADFDAHLAKAYTKAFMAKLPERLVGEIGIAPYTIVSPAA